VLYKNDRIVVPIFLTVSVSVTSAASINNPRVRHEVLPTQIRTIKGQMPRP